MSVPQTRRLPKPETWYRIDYASRVITLVEVVRKSKRAVWTLHPNGPGYLDVHHLRCGVGGYIGPTIPDVTEKYRKHWETVAQRKEEIAEELTNQAGEIRRKIEEVGE